MNESQFELITLTEGSRRSHPRAKQNSISFESDESSMRSSYVDMEDRELAHAIKRIEKLDAELRANEDEAHRVRELRERIDRARRSSIVAISQLNDKMDSIEQAWDDHIIHEQKAIAKEVLTILKDLKEDELSQALSWRKKRRSSKSRSRSSSTTASRSQSATSLGSGAHSSSMSKKIAHLNKKEREFADRAEEVKKDSRQIDAMSRNLDSLNELERVVCSKLGRLQSVGDVKKGSAVYGTVELVDNYKKSVENLAKAIRSLSDVSCLPAITNDDPITKAEIDKICRKMTEFMGRIKAQLGSNGPSAETTPAPARPQTSVRVAPRSRSSARPPPLESSSESGAKYASARATPTASSVTSVAASTAHSIESHQG